MRPKVLLTTVSGDAWITKTQKLFLRRQRHSDRYRGGYDNLSWKILNNWFNLCSCILIIKPESKDHDSLSYREYIVKQLGARRVEFIATAVICTIFAISFAYLEYYYIKDPALQISNGKVEVSNSNFDRSRETKPIIGNMYQYHLFPMLFIFVLISFASLWDDMAFKLFGRHKRIKALMLGFANLITAILIEDFAWFVNRWLVPLSDDPKGGMLMQFSDWTSMHLGAIDLGSFVIPNWYIIAVALATLAYYGAFRKNNEYIEHWDSKLIIIILEIYWTWLLLALVSSTQFISYNMAGRRQQYNY